MNALLTYPVEAPTMAIPTRHTRRSQRSVVGRVVFWAAAVPASLTVALVAVLALVQWLPGLLMIGASR